MLDVGPLLLCRDLIDACRAQIIRPTVLASPTGSRSSLLPCFRTLRRVVLGLDRFLVVMVRSAC